MKKLIFAVAVMCALAMDGSAQQQGMLDWAKRFEVIEDPSPRKSRPGDLVSSYGAVVDRSCLKGLSPEAREGLRGQLDAIVENTLRKIGDCHHAITPDINLLRRAAAIVNRMKLICVNSASDSHFQGKSPGPSAYTFLVPYLKEHIRNIPLEFQNLAKNDPQPLFIVIPDSFQQFLDHDAKHNEGTLFHESLHQTWANNQLDHANIENISVDLVDTAAKTSPCGVNKLDDRIMLFEAACGFNLPLASELRYRMRHCGMAAGCMDTLWQTPGIPLKYLSGPDADPKLQATFGPYWKTKGNAYDTCERIRSRLNGLAKKREIEDLDAEERVEQLGIFVGQNSGGFGKTIPDHYLKTLNKEERDIARSLQTQMQDGFEGNCDLRMYESIQNKKSLWMLNAINLDARREGCPYLDPAHPHYSLAKKLAGFHNLEHDLELKSFFLISQIKHFVTNDDSGSFHGFAARAIELFQESCPNDERAFEPRLCEEGEAKFIDAIAQIQKWLE